MEQNYFELIKELHKESQSQDKHDLHNLLTNLYQSRFFKESNCLPCFKNAWIVHSRNVQSLDLTDAKCLRKNFVKTWCTRQEILQDLHECLLSELHYSNPK